MKLSLVILFVCISGLFATETFSQAAKVSIEMTSASVKDILSDIEKQTDYLFVYDKSEINLERSVSVRMRNKTVAEVLNAILRNTDIVYAMEGNNIMLMKTQILDRDIQFTLQSGRKVSGKVLDETGEPVIGANVVVKGTTNGNITDIDGMFTIENVIENQILQISYIGYISQEVRYTGQATLTIKLVEDSQSLDEVVVVGYGTQKKLNLTGAVSAVSGEDLTKRPIANAAAMLQGQIPGLRVNQGLGEPGNEEVSLRVRGLGTFSGTASPLILVNGVAGSLTNLDPSMIESVSVLKDAAAASIYGARAAHGVILITTKQGSDQEGKVTIAYNGNFASHSPSKMFDLITNSAEYMELFNMAKTNSGQGGLYTDSEIEKYRNSNGSAQYPSFNWLDYMFNPALVHQHNLSLAGSQKNTTYNLALNYIDQDGTLESTNYKKYNITVDLTSKVTDFIRVGFYANMMKGDRRYNGLGQNDAILSAMSQAPTYMPWLPDDGSGQKRWTQKAYDYESNNKNMVQIVENGKYKHTNNNTDINAQVWMEVDLFKGLKWYAKGAVRQWNERDQHWRGGREQLYYYHSGENAELQGDEGLTVTEKRRLYTSLYTYLKYDYSTKNFAHNFSLMAGYSQETDLYETLEGYRRDYQFPLETLKGGVGAPNWSNDGDKEEWALQSGFFRFNYNFKERYLFEANARYDGSSRLSPEGRWGLFPSFSAAWRLTEEQFMKDLNLSWLSNAKIRGSWGQLGNQEIGLYPYQAMISAVSSYTFDKSSNSPAYFQTAYVNRDLEWEKTTSTDIGVELQFLNRLNVVFDWYKKKTTGILRSSQISGLLGMKAPTVNHGEMEDTGIELALNWSDHVRDGSIKGLNYNLGVFFDRTRNKLTKFGVAEMDGKVIREEGLSYNSYYMLECIGIFATEDEVKNAPKQFNDYTQPGDLRYKDVDGNGVIDNDDRTLIKGQYPGFEYSITGGADWKGFDFSFLMQGVQDKKYYIDANWGQAPFYQGSAPTKDYVKHMWTEENPHNAKDPKLYFSNMGGGKNTRTNSYFLEKASYLRMKNITLGYTFPTHITKKVHMDRLRIYFSGDNLFTISKFKGLDPERSGDGTATQYPQNKIYSIGINLNF